MTKNMDERACNFFDLGYNVKKTRKEVNDGKNTTLSKLARLA
ncbi:hypothetical protein MGAS9429_Spy0856 [Streptococcus pyogenes MGAS9429]|uniref:Uncharacterized protein n=1 Tax=Streptococcus pyogenes serotype M12 (strain MGAS9429) TaxID=370551 RepID=Q1JM25_STRPC|nr:hypothetical protein M28_Spy0721 [Streptococcus pyogenes MGAS6180]ABF32044.1 hypothetical protein MGAS9429_Spy0856 [Streptococcus pyogenes MGAS9429]ABF35868.1 hypothetical protein MGAS2096_Spy0816 [Streptococcus pyogenes MGAS2096]